MLLLAVKVCWLYQGFARGVGLVLGASQQEAPGQDVEPLSSSLGAVVHLKLPQLKLIERSTPQEPGVEGGRVSAITFFCLISF